MTSKKILTQGIVQGVGFRPYVYRLATSLNLKGYVRNLGNVVEIILEGDEIELFIQRLQNELPPIARIDSINVLDIDEKGYDEFSIIESSDSYSGVSVIPPDIAICDSCLDEIRNPTDRRYKYPFNACTDCGPRFTVIDSVPYDRDKTSMDEFPLCDDCLVEYRNPLDRRYHGEAICCSDCGPQMAIYKKDELIECDNPIKLGSDMLKEGKILAIKGIGGTHLVVDAYNDDAICKLRSRLNRPNQAFAVMSSDLDAVKRYAWLSSREIETITSNKRPIVILKKNENYDFPESLSPGLHNIGVMLPYSPMHYLLFDEGKIDTYVMTSANIPGEPMMIDNAEIINGISDYSLVHNRKILNRCDDSVIRFRNNELSFIRRSRGYTPEPYTINYDVDDLNVLSLGPELDVTFCLATDAIAYPSQHIGDTNKLKTLNFLKNSIKHMKRITKICNIDAVACDLHPQFFTTKLAYEFGVDVVPVQHHHAHAVALANDHEIDEMIVIAADGTGYGDDHTSWGGEILYTDIKSYERMGHLERQKMPGGDLATKYPIRMLLSILKDEELIKNYAHQFKYGEMEIENIFKQLDKGINVGITTSTGRVLDSVSAALEICNERTYEGEASMKLESAAYYSTTDLELPLIIKDNVLNTTEIVKEAVNLYLKGHKKADIANAVQKTVAIGLSEIAINCADKKGLVDIGATGGVFYNEAITNACKNHIESNEYNFIQHKNTCCGDGSVSLGQAIVAKMRMSN
ncbi:MAG: carbamoyltransferase HypF [Methanobrevibacter millerae]|uniref:Carbamoyltransferase n=1 Tax=Methanobrevibacter millerae TaxID=230361 RepID=A0A8T3VM18_9EURY|nr:carbamoyltransferase HypF [Methanobrevibacter millerae]MBE6505791.1 carbamoyltransferase HypF [Methanobrevibacter millerae]